MYGSEGVPAWEVGILLDKPEPPFGEVQVRWLLTEDYLGL